MIHTHTHIYIYYKISKTMIFQFLNPSHSFTSLRPSCQIIDQFDQPKVKTIECSPALFYQRILMYFAGSVCFASLMLWFYDLKNTRETCWARGVVPSFENFQVQFDVLVPQRSTAHFNRWPNWCRLTHPLLSLLVEIGRWAFEGQYWMRGQDRSTTS